MSAFSGRFFLKNTFHYDAALTVAVVAFSTVLLLKSNQPTSETQGSASSPPRARGASGPIGFFHRARHFVINNPIMTYIQGEDKTLRVMELLLNHVIIGVAYDDSARAYPPRCHPGTRINILERLTTWFYNIKRAHSLIWLNGPAGVGKSAILQTFAESIKHIVVSVFISRPNERNDPNLIFTTIAYQLAVRIDAYREYIVERLAADPYLLKKSMQTQFQVFITEPFSRKNIGVGGPPVAILLDGLDEVDGADAQRDIIRLISSFTHEHPDAPLAWIISSRPERHISDTFNEVTVKERHESEDIPIDSTDACRDVERFLRDSFSVIKQEFQSFSLGNWPEETVFTKLANAASGLFIFADTAVRFIRDHDQAHPVQRLELVLSVIDRLKDVPIEERPLALLDNLYTEILSRIPSGLWPTTKSLMRLALFFRSADSPLGLRLGSQSRTLRGMTMILQLDHRTVYAALNKCFSILGIPSWENAHNKRLTFLHASFPDYLTDSKRSDNFYIDTDGIEDDVLLYYANLWHEQFGSNSTTGRHFVDECDNGDEMDEFRRSIFADMTQTLLSQMVERHTLEYPVSPISQRKRRECLNSLQKVNMISLCNRAWSYPCHSSGEEHTAHSDLLTFVQRTFYAWQKSPRELAESGLLRQVSFKNTNISYHYMETCEAEGWLFVGGQCMNGDELRAVRTLFGRCRNRNLFPRAPDPMEAFFSGLPEFSVLICGTVPEGRIALLKADHLGTQYYIVPYRE